jgi:uncharacterized protein (DUF302 family)
MLTKLTKELIMRQLKLTSLLSIGIFLLAGNHAFAACPNGKTAVGKNCVDTHKVHYVKPGKESVLQTIINNAKQGDYVVLKSGNHHVSSTGINTGLAIKGKKSLTLFGEDGAWIRTKEGWVVILDIANSEKITIQNVSMVHDVERGYCFGSVVKLSDVKNIKILDSVMDGSGTQAVEMINAQGVQISGGKAFRNTEGVFDIRDSKHITIKNMVIAENDNSGYYKKGILDIENSDNVSFFNNVVKDNKNGYFKKVTHTKRLYIKGNKFSNNVFDSKTRAVVQSDTGLINIKSAHSVKNTVKRLESLLLKQKGIKILAKLNHVNVAKRLRKRLRPTGLLVFSHPKAAISLIQCQQTMAIDLPQKVLIWKDETGQVWLTYNNPEYLANRHKLAGCAQKIIKLMAEKLNQATRQAAKP